MVEVNPVINSYNHETQLNMLATLLGYKHIPVDIETFLNDDYYLGTSCGRNPRTGKSVVFDIWHQALQKVYPDGIRTSTFVANCGCIGCLTGDTKVKLLDGRSIPIRTLYNDYPNGNFEVYSFNKDTKTMEAGKCSGVYYTGKKKIYSIKIKDKDGNISETRCTGDHKFLLTSGSYKKAADLQPGDSIESIYFRYGSHFYEGYQEFFSNSLHHWYPTHRWIAGERTFSGTSVHHVNFDTLDNTTSNLYVFKDSNSHSYFHAVDYWSHEEAHIERQAFMKQRNESGKTSQSKLLRFADYIKNKYPTLDNIKSIDDLKRIRDEFVKEGILDFRCGNFSSYEEFLSMYNQVVGLPPSIDKVNRNLANLKRQHDRTVSFNKNHPNNRKDITFQKVIKFAQDNKEGDYNKIAKGLNCSRMRITNVLSPVFNTSVDFYKFLGLEPTIYGYVSQRKYLENKIKKLGGLDFHELNRMTGYSQQEITDMLLSKYPTLKDAADAIGIPFQNHTVVSVTDTGDFEDVYDMTVDEYHNYGIEDDNGNIIFVHNSGKSLMAKIMLAYDIYKITMLEDPGAYFGLIKKFYHFVIFNLTKDNAEKMVTELKDMLSKSLYFQEQMQDSESVMQWITIDPASRMSDIISNDVISIVFSEMNFVRDPSQGIKLIDQGISRVESRFQKGIGLFNHIILDSSDTSVEAPVPYFLSHHVRGPETVVFKYAIWEAKPDLYFHQTDPLTGKKTFTVYKGDNEILPCIIKDNTDTTGMDPDRFLEVPLELKEAFEADIELALNEKAGVAVETTTQYFRGDKVVQAMVYDMKMPEIISIDFAGPESFIPYFESLVDSLPDDRCLFGGLDLGISGDKAGFALGYIENLNMRDNDGVISYDPHVVVPCCVSFDRPPGQETNIDKIVDLIFWIHSRRPFFRFVMDTYQSFPIKQKLIVGGINADFISVDKKTIYYKTAKQMIYAGKAKLPKSTLLKNELINLIDLGTKIDHHHVKNAAGDIGSDSKDAADALTRLLVAMHDATEEAMDPPIISNTARKKYNDELVRQWVEGEAKMKYQIMFGNQFGLPVDFRNPFD